MFLSNKVKQLQHLKILILDDNGSNVRILERMLQMAGYQQIHGMTDSREILHVYESYKPDLLLLDLSMPYMDGFEVMQLLRETIEEADYFPILIITAHSDQESRLRALELGARDFIGKPFNQSELLMRVGNLLELRQLYVELRKNNEELEQKVAEQTALWKETQMELVQRLGHVIEFRDEDTGFHIARMSHYSAALGRAAGLNEKAVELLLHASTLHDIGKIAIPDHILLKPGKLDPEEMEEMRAHALIGADMLKDSTTEMIQMAYTIALSHHEKWDGTGYPYGLKGEDIPLVARIVAVCDVYDALTSERPYKSAWSDEDALACILADSGKHFDPQLVEIFLRIFPEIQEIQRNYSTVEVVHQ
ncbi:HD domain-containing phosphohydrolase [Ectobacillus ponti]|uniref:Response regulator n=1 Tax=Ectobacillus ponti TaxID=2961894 RepID=A0AA41X3P1_9BACI|nr:HD domain-containing phosphohydrolase [Ectobacillus ponti]MCP8968087.1 response regulator [Ectobacillus ponti]